MPLLFVKGDITKIKADAIVNAANNSLLGGGGVDGAIHRAAGPELLAECRTLHGCETGEAKITGAYRLPCKYVIHTVGPVYRGGKNGEPELLRSCYIKSLELAAEKQCESVAFPAISTGVYGYPKEEAAEIAASAAREFLETHDMTVLFVYYNGAETSGRRELAEYIRRHWYEPAKYNVYSLSEETEDAEYVAEAETGETEAAEEEDLSEAKIQAPLPAGHSEPNAKAARKNAAGLFKRRKKTCDSVAAECDSAVFDKASKRREAFAGAAYCQAMQAAAAKPMGAHPDFRGMLDESFSQMLLRKIDESGMSDSECYHRANIDRKLFSKIRSDALYRPSKPTAIAFAVALRLPPDEAEEMLKKAGYAFSQSSLFDVIIRFFIEQKEYDILKINEELFRYDQPLLGA